jgi:hypothetical protein
VQLDAQAAVLLARLPSPVSLKLGDLVDFAASKVVELALTEPVNFGLLILVLLLAVEFFV